MAPKKATTKKVKKEKKVYIYQWPFVSSKEVAGMKAQYSVLLAEDGTLSCNCPGWIFYRDKTKPRTCSHLKHDEVQKNYKTYLSMHKKGMLVASGDMTSVPVNLAKTIPDVPFARAILLD